MQADRINIKKNLTSAKTRQYLRADGYKIPQRRQYVQPGATLGLPSTIMKNFNKLTFIIATILFGLLLIPGFWAAWAEDEGTLGTNIIWLTFAKLFYIFRFPTHTLLWTVFSTNGTIIYFVGLMINCLLYGFITERLISFVKYKRPASAD